MLFKKRISGPGEFIVFCAETVQKGVAGIHHHVHRAFAVRVADGDRAHHLVPFRKIYGVETADDRGEFFGVLDFYGVTRILRAVHFFDRSACGRVYAALCRKGKHARFRYGERRVHVVVDDGAEFKVRIFARIHSRRFPLEESAHKGIDRAVDHKDIRKEYHGAEPHYRRKLPDE